jgi:hypothetical protein
VDVVDAFASAAATTMAAFAATDSGEDMVTRRRWDTSIRWRLRCPKVDSSLSKGSSAAQ